MPLIFGDKNRTTQDPMSYGEGDWDFLDRSGMLEAQRVRDFINYWVSEYPKSDRDSIIPRIKSRTIGDFESATFELTLFALLRSMGCTVSIHPNLPNGNAKHPDFLAITPRGEHVYVEAVSALGYSKANISARNRTDAVFNAIEKTSSPNFFINVEVENDSDRSPNGKRLCSYLNRWLASLDPDTVALEVSKYGDRAVPRTQWRQYGWSIAFEATPKRPESRDKNQRVIGSIFVDGERWVNEWESIRDAVRMKGKRYGNLPHPLLVAINVDVLHADRSNEMIGLFGHETCEIRIDNVAALMRRFRGRNGAWFGQKRPQYTRVSGAWIFHSLTAWNIVSRNNTVYFNPWATKPLPALFTTLYHAKTEQKLMQWTEGRSLGEILGLPDE